MTDYSPLVLALTDHVRTAEGQRKYHLPIGAPIRVHHQLAPLLASIPTGSQVFQHPKDTSHLVAQHPSGQWYRHQPSAPRGSRVSPPTSLPGYLPVNNTGTKPKAAVPGAPTATYQLSKVPEGMQGDLPTNPKITDIPGDATVYAPVDGSRRFLIKHADGSWSERDGIRPHKGAAEFWGKSDALHRAEKDLAAGKLKDVTKRAKKT